MLDRPGSQPFGVLVVCTGNLHRSPLAERLLAVRLAPASERVHVSSAGTAALTGAPMDPAAASLLSEMGGDPGGAVARRLTSGLVSDAALVLGAASEHREAAVRLCPVHGLRSAFTLREFARLLRGEDAAGLTDPAERAAALTAGAAARRGLTGPGSSDDDLVDPYGASEQEARACAARITEAVQRIAAAVLG
ncbi:low molecular weight phosphatase family protein [Streptomyces sp. NPDC057445]|uniref:arsenate reductase/protein-tyrosine-phosphatase family protein n=1 Tax=Streptomyces sp. NPDC057445 TaxID=3346136 RepID=UPI0036C5F1AC